MWFHTEDCKTVELQVHTSSVSSVVSSSFNSVVDDDRNYSQQNLTTKVVTLCTSTVVVVQSFNIPSARLKPVFQVLTLYVPLVRRI